MTIVAVTETEYRKAPDIFEAAASGGLKCISAPPDEAELARTITATGASHAIVGIQPYVGPLYAALKRGAVLARFGVGHDSIDKAQATAAGLLVTNTPGALDDSVAELTMALILAAARHIPTVTRDTREGGWRQIVGVELRERTLAVIGCGAIGCRVARIASRGFGMRVIGVKAHDTNRERLMADFGFDSIVTDLAPAVANADFVSLHVPGTPATRHLLNAERLAMLPAGAWLINTARGSVVDEAALYDALAAGRLGGAALDVCEREPYAPADPGRDLLALPNVILTPHVGSSTRQACVRMARHALANIAAAQRQDYASMNIVNPDVLALLTNPTTPG